MGEDGWIDQWWDEVETAQRDSQKDKINLAIWLKVARRAEESYLPLTKLYLLTKMWKHEKRRDMKEMIVRRWLGNGSEGEDAVVKFKGLNVLTYILESIWWKERTNSHNSSFDNQKYDGGMHIYNIEMKIL